ncbi:mitogen-activated protein kinase kinase kinase 19 [Conger conger]|uniref:mitogen-activated protein kinase kinase kinase 19 n=1 Tax=Conger conger TaxID=82655 RepID=UPI002A5AEFE7|nr:mitogen-activated protein kinase kinase kinase 19 [Conger conger]
MRQEYQELEGRSRQGTSLPSLWERGRRGKLCPLDTGQGLLMTKGRTCLPTPLRAAGKGEPVPTSLPGPHPAQLSQSAPLLGEPLLDSASLLRVRAHIQTRLGGSETDTETHRTRQLLPALPTRRGRTPKLLEPLASGQREEAVRLGCKHPLPLKPIGLLPLTSVSKAKRERLIWRATHGPHRARGGGSEGSSSSSLSSQGSLDLEEEEVEEAEEKEETSEGTGGLGNEPAESKEVPLATVLCESSALDLLPSLQPFIRTKHEAADLSGKQGAIDDFIEDRGSIISRSDRTVDCEVLFGAAQSELAHGLGCKLPERICNGTDINDTEDTTVSGTGKGQAAPQLAEAELRAQSLGTGSPFPEKNTDNVTETTRVYDLRSQSTAVTNQLGLHVVHITVSESDVLAEETSNPSKAHHTKEKENGISFQTNESFNILAHKDHSRFTRKSKSHQRSTFRAAHLKGNIRNPPDLTVSTEATAKPCSQRTSSQKASQKTTSLLPRNRPAEQLRPIMKRPGTDRGSSNKLDVLARKQSLQRDLKCTRQPKKVGSQVMPRAKSAVDFITYSDMFQEINQGDNGPAIYEMFATPVYDNLRVCTSRVRFSPRQVQSAPPRKNQGRRNLNHLKPLENSRQKKGQREKSSPARGKAKRKSDVTARGKSSTPLASEDEEEDVVFISGLNWHIKTTKCELIFGEADAENEPCVEEQQEEQNLSVIEEVLSNYPSETRAATGDENPPTSPEPQQIACQQTLNDQLPAEDEGPLSSPQNEFYCEKPESSCSPSFPKQPKRNTWTSGSRDRTMSPMFKKYLDVAGEGPLTDDLLQCLAKELISLEEGEVTLQPENRASCEKGIQEVSQAEKENPLPEGIMSSGESSAAELSPEGEVRWTKGEILGRGAYGTVYCGLTDQGQLIAVKQVALDDSDPETAGREYQRLQDEVDLLKTLRHMNIVGFLGTTLQDNVVSIFMEYVPGGSIASIIHRFGPLPERVLALYTRQILEGVAYLHKNRVIHRDLKGNNVMLMPTGIVKLIDFGCARRLSCLSHSSSNGELLRSVHGTPFWMAPEVINETGHGRKSDIWSVGCTVFEMATGRPPLAHMEKMAALFYIAARRGLMPTLPDEFSEDARNFVQACLTSDQRDRPSAQELLLYPFIPPQSTASSST